MSIAICGDPEVIVIEAGAEYAVALEPDAETVVVTAGEQGPPGGAGAAISDDPDNRLTTGSDNGLYVRDDLIPDPLAYYILAKG